MFIIRCSPPPVRKILGWGPSRLQMVTDSTDAWPDCVMFLALILGFSWSEPSYSHSLTMIQQTIDYTRMFKHMFKLYWELLVIFWMSEYWLVCKQTSIPDFPGLGQVDSLVWRGRRSGFFGGPRSSQCVHPANFSTCLYCVHCWWLKSSNKSAGWYVTSVSPLMPFLMSKIWPESGIVGGIFKLFRGHQCW